MSQSPLPLPGWGLGAGGPLRPGLLRLRSGWATAELVELSPDSQLDSQLSSAELRLGPRCAFLEPGLPAQQ